MFEELVICAQLCAHTENTDATALPPGWIVEDPVLSLALEEPYVANIVLYINRTRQQAIFVCQTNETLGIVSTTLLQEHQKQLMQRLPSSLTQLEDVFARKIADVHFIFTGFGQGGSLAQLYAYSFNVHAFVLNSPGNRTLLENTFTEDHRLGTLHAHARALLHNVLTKPNPINTYDEQIGDVYRLKIPHVGANSWSHYAFSILDLASFISNFLMIGSCVKAGSTSVQLATASTKMAEAQASHEIALLFARETAEAAAKQTLTESAFQATLRGSFHMKELSTTVNSAKDAFRLSEAIWTGAKVTANSAMQTAVINTGTATAFKIDKCPLFKTKANEWQHSIGPIAAFLGNGDQRHALISMRSWPRVCQAPKTWGRFFTELVLPTRGRYILDENAYIEASSISLLPGYEEEARAEPRFEFAPAGAGAGIESTTLRAPTTTLTATYDLSANSLTSRALNSALTHIDLHPDRFTLLRNLNIANNLLTDEAARLLSLATWMERLEEINLSRNRITYAGFLILVTALASPSTTVQVLNISENRIHLTYDATRELRTDKRINISANIADLESEIAAELSPTEHTTNQTRNQTLIENVTHHFSLFARDDGFKSIFPWVTQDFNITADRSLLFVVANRALIDQHAFLLIERVNAQHLKEIIIYELFFDQRTQRAFVSCTHPTPSHRRLTDLLEDNGSYQSAHYSISREMEHILIPRLNSDVRRGRALNYHSFASRNSDGTERINCAKWLADHLRAIHLPADLGWLNLPRDLVDQRSWLRRTIGL